MSTLISMSGLRVCVLMEKKLEIVFDLKTLQFLLISNDSELW